jgi:predicted methyltransferase
LRHCARVRDERVSGRDRFERAVFARERVHRFMGGSPSHRNRTTMKNLPVIGIAALVTSGLALALAAEVPIISKEITAAVKDSTRPDSDVAKDANRKPSETLAFVGIQPGDKVADYAAGSGYFTRLFQDVVGPSGHVYALVPGALFQYPNIVKGTGEILAYAASHPAVTVTFGAVSDTLRFPDKLDIFWISQNYHDLHDSFMGPVDMTAFNRAVFESLKPGGVYVVLDHVAAVGAPPDVTDTLHRIEPKVVRREVEAAGFVFEAESRILANPQDPHTAGVFDKLIRGRTDQFIYKFRKPSA